MILIGEILRRVSCHGTQIIVQAMQSSGLRFLGHGLYRPDNFGDVIH